MLLVLLLALCWPRASLAAPGFSEGCERALAKQEVDELVEQMRTAARAGPCMLARVDTSMFRTQIEWRADERTWVVLLGPRGCMIEPSHEGEHLAYYAPAELGEVCPAALAGVRSFVGEPREELVPVVRQVAPELEAPVDPEHIGVSDPLVVASVGWLALVILGGIASVRAWPRLRADASSRGFVLAAAGLLVLGLVARFHVEASVGNWYGSFLPASGLGELRFGASAAVLQAVVRACSAWTAAHAFALARVTGAAAIVLVMVVVRRLGGSLAAAVLAGSLLALEPVPVRLSASSAEHVLAGTLALTAWAAWLRSGVDPGPVPRVTAVVATLLAVLTRADCWPQLCALPLWSLLARPRDEQGEAWLPLARRIGDALFFWLCWAAIGVYAWFQIVIPSNHPGPDPAGIRSTAQVLISQLWTVASTPPFWITPVCVGLAVLGLAALLLARRWGLAAAALLSWALVFVPLGRNLTHDGLTGARYFVLALPLLVVLAAALAEVLTRVLASTSVRHKTTALALALALAWLALIGIELAAVRPGWGEETTFQAEYRFLAGQLAARETDGCTLHFVGPRQPTNEPDLDCCLAPDRSPLSLLAPGLAFRPMPAKREPDDAHGCQLYYVGSLCSIDPELAPRASKTVARIHEQCERLRARGGADVIARQELTPQSLTPRFRSPPIVELFGR